MSEIDFYELDELLSAFDGEEYDTVPQAVLIVMAKKNGGMMIDKPQTVPRPPKPECEKKHITKSGK